MLGHRPALGKYYEVHIRSPFLSRGRSQHREDGRVGVIEQKRADGSEGLQIVFVGRVIAMPGDNIERRVIEIA